MAKHAANRDFDIEIVDAEFDDFGQEGSAEDWNETPVEGDDDGLDAEVEAAKDWVEAEVQIVDAELVEDVIEGDLVEADVLSDESSALGMVAVDPGKKGKGKKAKKEKKPKKELPRYMRKSRRMRRFLVVVAVLLVLLIGALAYLSFQLFQESQQLAAEHAQEQQGVEEVEKIQEDAAQDAPTEAVKKTSAPNLSGLMGLTQDQALEKLQKHGAVVTSTKTAEPPAEEKAEGEGGAAAPAEPAQPPAEDDGDPVKTSLTIALTAEPVDTRTGTPTVYLGLDKDGLVIQAGYSASAAALGYGAYSFVDAVKNNYIVERTLQEAGIAVPEGAAQLPEDKLEYSTYADDGITISKEYCPFSGVIAVEGKDYLWSSVLSYDYSVANAAGATNLSDVIRIIYIYLEVPLS